MIKTNLPINNHKLNYVSEVLDIKNHKTKGQYPKISKAKTKQYLKNQNQNENQLIISRNREVDYMLSIETQNQPANI